MYSSVRPLYRHLWIILVSIVCQTSLTWSCRTSFKDVPYLRDTKDKMIWHTDKIDEKYVSFSEYISAYYNQQTTAEEISFLFDKWKEFDAYINLINNNVHKDKSKDDVSKRKKKYQCPNNVNKLHKADKAQRNHNKPQNIQASLPLSLSMLRNVIDNRDETNLMISIKSADRKSKIKSKTTNSRVYSKYEAEMAWNATEIFDHPHHGACKIQKKTFCMSKYFSLQQENKDLINFYPPSISVMRCSLEKCQCFKNNHECRAVNIKSRDHYIIGIDEKRLPWTWAFYITHHVECKCLPKCHLKKCINPFRLRIYNEGNGIHSCECFCPVGKERKCNAIKTGKKRFSASDYFCIVSGKCLKPQCTLQQLSEENLYNRRCLRKL